MKYKKLALAFLLSANCMAAKIPDCWMNSELCQDEQKSNFEMKEVELDSDFDCLIEAKSNIVENSASTMPEKGFYLAEIETAIGVEVGGAFGIFGGGGAATIKYIWTRNSASKNSNKANSDEDINLAELNNFEELDSMLSVLGNNLAKQNRIKDAETFKVEATREIVKLFPLIQALQQKHESAWAPEKLQLQLKFAVSGKLAAGPSIGAGFRLRLDWDYNKQMNKSLLTSVNEHSQVFVHNTNFISALCEDFESFTQAKLDSHYQLNEVKIGFGVGAEGDLYFIKGEGSVVLSVIFTRAENKSNFKSNPASIASYPMHIQDNSLMMKGLTGENVDLSRQRFQNGLEKLKNASSFFVAGAARREQKMLKKGKIPNFSLGAIELEIELFATGSVGLASIEGVSVMEFVFEKI